MFSTATDQNTPKRTVANGSKCAISSAGKCRSRLPTIKKYYIYHINTDQERRHGACRNENDNNQKKINEVFLCGKTIT
jgi:hypothetical protein